MSQLGHLLADGTARDVARLGQVGAGREKERFAGHGDGGDLAPGRPLLLRVQHRGELHQRLRPERRRPGVVAVVVEGDEGQHLAAGQRHIAQVGVRDHLVL